MPAKLKAVSFHFKVLNEATHLLQLSPYFNAFSIQFRMLGMLIWQALSANTLADRNRQLERIQQGTIPGGEKKIKSITFGLSCS